MCEKMLTSVSDVYTTVFVCVYLQERGECFGKKSYVTLVSESTIIVRVCVQ